MGDKFCLPGGGSMHRIGGGCCVQSEGMGERKSLNTLQKQTPQSSMAYSDALTMKLLEIQPTRLFKCDRSAMLTVPLPWPSPQSQQSTLQIHFTLNSAHQLTTALPIQNIMYLSEEFTSYLFVCTLK